MSDAIMGTHHRIKKTRSHRKSISGSIISILVRGLAVQHTQYIRLDCDIQQQTGQRDQDDAEPEHRGRVHLPAQEHKMNTRKKLHCVKYFIINRKTKLTDTYLLPYNPGHTLTEINVLPVMRTRTQGKDKT